MRQMTDSRLIAWAIKETKEKYARQVALLVESRSTALESDRNVRYANYIIVDGGPCPSLGRCMIIDGIGFDLWQQNWTNLEEKADINNDYFMELVDGKILYSRSESDKQRFLYLQAKFLDHLADFPYMYDQGQKRIKAAMDLYRDLLFGRGFRRARKLSGLLADQLCLACAFLNQTYFKTLDYLGELKAMPHTPKSFFNYYQRLLTAQEEDEIRVISEQLILSTRSLFASLNPRPPVDPPRGYQHLADWYEECCYYFRRLYAFCRQKNPALVYRQACAIQANLDNLAVQDRRLPSFDLLTDFDADDLPGYAERAESVEKQITDAIGARGAKLESYLSIEDFLIRNP